MLKLGFCLQICITIIWVGKIVESNVYRMSMEAEDIMDLPRDNNGADGEVYQIARHFQNNMVLQRGPSQATIYGFSNVMGGKVILMMDTYGKKNYYVSHTTKGPSPLGYVWSIQLDPMPAGEVITLTIVFPSKTIVLSNIIFGDVWLCSGQSNMQFAVSQMFNATEEIANAHKYPNIRLMAVALTQSDTPLYDVPGFRQNWDLPSNDTVSHFSAVCWLYGRFVHSATGIPMGMISTEWGGTPVEAWSSPDALKKCNVTESSKQSSWASLKETDKITVNGDFPPQKNSVLWNAMINPFVPMTIYGAIWYQGEADSTIPLMMNRYNCTFPAMIQDWRAKFYASFQQTNGTFPFGFVQLAANQDDPSLDHGFPDIRWHQTADVGYVPNAKMPNVFMAVALDLPDFHSPWGSVHPRDKLDVGQRLAWGGLDVAYGIKDTFQGPFPLKGTRVLSEFQIDYDSKGALDTRDYNGFEFLCEKKDGVSKWEATNITRKTDTSVYVLFHVCKAGYKYTPRRLRYNWRVSPCAFKKCAVYSQVNDLPAPPFVADIKKDKFGVPFADFGQV